MKPFLARDFGNAGSIHEEGRVAKKAVDEAREKISRLIHVRPAEIIFTSGATEANNLAIFGTFELIRHRVSYQKMHVITTAIEHQSVLEPIKKLEKGGVKVTYLPVYENGIVRTNDLRKALRPETVLVSIMYANNEIGTTQPIKKMSRIIKQYKRNLPQGEALGLELRRPVFHIDAAQAPGYLPIMMDSLGVDLASFGAHKCYGPKGVGFLYKRWTANIFSQILGGDQEGKMRAGTENVAGIVGMAVALELAEKKREKSAARILKLRDYFIAKVLQEIPGAILNGDAQNRLANNVNFSFPGVEGEQMGIELDARGIACSTGSACTTEKVGPSHVILALGGRGQGEGFRERAVNTVRFSMGRLTTRHDLDYVVKCVKEIIAKQKKLGL